MAVPPGGGPGPGPGTGSARRFPTGANYAEALQHPELCFSDPDLRHGTVQQSPVLGPKAISGNFASVFSVTARNGQRYALKCFTRDSPTLGKRYAAISAALGGLGAGGLSQPWPVGFDFLEQGVLVGREWYPAVKMTWIQGTGLISWIERNLDDPAALHALAERFLAMTADLEKHGIAHGDLQHGNLLVAADGTFRLVDYDGMYVPALRGEQATENGHRNYQSPTRTAADFGPAMDRFSAWTIELALLAVATDPGLWTQLHDRHGEFLILSEADFKEPATSLAWPVLLTHPDKRVRDMASRVKSFLGRSASALPPLTQDAVRIPGQRTGPGAASGTGTNGYGSGLSGSRPTVTSWTPAASATPTPASGVPAWMVGRVAASTPAQQPAAGAGVRAGFARRGAGDLVAAVGALLSTSTPGALVLAAAQPVDVLPAAQGVALLTSAAMVGLGRRRRPECRAARKRVRELKRRSRELADPASAYERLEKEIRALDEALAKDNTASDQRIQALQIELRDGQSRITMDLNRRTDQAQQQLAGLAAKERRLLDKALEPAIRAHIQDRLRRTPIQEALSLSNMGAKMVRALQDAGIRSAADFIGVDFSHNPSVVFLVRPGGQRVRVPGIGEARATALSDWRQGLERRARATAPTTVPATTKAQIKSDIATLRRTHKAEIKQAEAESQQKKSALQRRITDERARLTAQRQQRAMDTQRKRAELLQRQKQLAGAEVERARVVGELAVARKEARGVLGAGRYVRFLVTGR
uniref:Protein kinase domain-containing protein n=1 Tax=Streptomyces sp. NBC_00093 TaxID=2975649 RepID=A0AAU2A2U8_9ACTN